MLPEDIAHPRTLGAAPMANGLARVAACCLAILVVFMAVRTTSRQVVASQRTKSEVAALSSSESAGFVNSVRNAVEPYLGTEIWFGYGRGYQP